MNNPKDSIEPDEFDLKILRLLQVDANCSMAELGDRVGLSHTPCWRRLKRLESSGIIRSKVTLLDAKKLNLGVTVHAYLTTISHDENALNALESAVQDIPEIVECYSTSGEKDYLLRIVTESVDEYEKLFKKTLVHLPNVASVNSTFALKQIKYTTELPI
jgi:Lrp/AsnC family transcriptional regulator